jgi:hypothetical protein
VPGTQTSISAPFDSCFEAEQPQTSLTQLALLQS